MTTDVLLASSTELGANVRRHIGRYENKSLDFDAFPASRGYPDLARAQMRYIGAGGAWEKDKIEDPNTLPPGRFTLSIVTQMPGCYAAAHTHECKEAFLALQGQLTVGWVWDDEVIEANLNYKDLCLNTVGMPHGFRNDGVEPVFASIMVGSRNPLPPHYTCHPKDAEPEVARHFGAARGKVHKLDPYSDDPRHREMSRHVIRYSQVKPVREPAGFARLPYIGAEGAPPGSFCLDFIHAPPGVGVKSYEREVEETYFVVEGVLTIGWEQDGRIHEERLGPRDLLFTPPGQAHFFRNDGLGPAQFTMSVGSAIPQRVNFRAS